MDKKEKIKSKADIAASAGFILLIAFLLIACILAPDKAVSENENRSLSPFPEIGIAAITSGNFMRGFEAYASDHLVFRDALSMLKNTADAFLGKKDNGSIFFGKDGFLFPIDRIDERQLEKNIGYTKHFIEGLKKENPELKCSVLLAPTSAEIMKDRLPQYAQAPDQGKAAAMAEEAMGSTLLYPSDVMEKHKEEYIYYRTDHHWTSLGAYYAYTAWAGAYGLEPVQLDSFAISTVSNSFYGTNYSKGARLSIEPDSIQVLSNYNIVYSTMDTFDAQGKKQASTKIFDESYLAVKDKYSYFLSGNKPLAIIKTPVQNGKKILVIKDSYANSFIPFLTSHFEEIYVADLRYYKQSTAELAKENGITDVLFLYNIIQYSNNRDLAYLLK